MTTWNQLLLLVIAYYCAVTRGKMTRSVLAPVNSAENYGLANVSIPQNFSALTICFWWNVPTGRQPGHIFSYSKEADTDWILIGMDSIPTMSLSMFGGNYNMTDPEPEKFIGWTHTCFVISVNDKLSWYRKYPGSNTFKLLREMAFGAGPSGTTREGKFVLFQDQDSYGGGFQSDRAASGIVATIDIWDTAFSLDELNGLTCSDAGNLFTFDLANFTLHGDLKETIVDVPCSEQDYEGKVVEEDFHSGHFCRVEGKHLASLSLTAHTVSAERECLMLCLKQALCEAMNYRTQSLTDNCELGNFNDLNRLSELAAAQDSVHFNTKSCI